MKAENVKMQKCEEKRIEAREKTEPIKMNSTKKEDRIINKKYRC